MPRLTQEQENDLAGAIRTLLRAFLPADTSFALIYRIDEASGQLVTNMNVESIRMVMESFLHGGEFVRRISDL